MPFLLEAAPTTFRAPKQFTLLPYARCFCNHCLLFPRCLRVDSGPGSRSSTSLPAVNVCCTLTTRTSDAESRSSADILRLPHHSTFACFGSFNICGSGSATATTTLNHFNSFATTAKCSSSDCGSCCWSPTRRAAFRCLLLLHLALVFLVRGCEGDVDRIASAVALESLRSALCVSSSLCVRVLYLRSSFVKATALSKKQATTNICRSLTTAIAAGNGASVAA